MPRNILPWALLALALVVFVFMVRRHAGSASASMASASSSGTPALDAPDRPLDETELRESRVRAGPQRCEASAQHVNELEGNAPKDAKGMAVIGSCLRRGNLAWSKCILAATTLSAASACDRRLLTSEGGP